MRATASKSALVLSGCQAWMHPLAKWYDESKRKPEDLMARDTGIAFHDAIHSVASQGSDPNYFDEGIRHRVAAAAKYLSMLKRDMAFLSTEVFVSTDFESGVSRCDESVSGRGYPDWPGFLHGTADVVGILPDGRLYVADWKTGGGNGVKEQLMTLLAGFRNVLVEQVGYDPLSVGPALLEALYVLEDPSAPGGAFVSTVAYNVTAEELDSHCFAMSMALALPAKMPAAAPGIHCTQLYCPSLAYCAAVSEVSEVASEGQQGLLPARALLRRYEMTDEPTSDAHAGYIMERVAAARRQLNYYEEGVRRHMLGGGRVISGEYEWKKTGSGVRWSKAK